MAVAVECRNLSKQFDSQIVLDSVNWKIPAGRMVGLIGTSGAGKTTLLRLIAGLDQPSRGDILFTADGEDVVQRRHVRASLFFQSLALWPQLTVRKHVEIVLPKRDQGKTAEAILQECRIPRSLWQRRPNELSGGEAQRVALARAWASRPNLLLLDEPLANVDSALRSDLASLFYDILLSREITVVYVTHNWDEVAEICDLVAVLDEGRIIQQGVIEDVYWSPANARVGQIAGRIHEIPREWLRMGYVIDRRQSGDSGNDYCVRFRPQQLILVEPVTPNRWTVEAVRPIGVGWHLTLRSETGPWRIVAAQAAKVGEDVGVLIVDRPDSGLYGHPSFGKKNTV